MKTDAEWERFLQKMKDDFVREADKSIERAVGVYYEKLQDDLEKVDEATDFIKEQLDRQVTREEYGELADDVDLNRLAVVETNKAVGKLRKRVGKLENHA